MVRETKVSRDDLIYPLFVDEDLRGGAVGANSELEHQVVRRPPADADEPMIVEQLQVVSVAEKREVPWP